MGTNGGPASLNNGPPGPGTSGKGSAPPQQSSFNRNGGSGGGTRIQTSKLYYGRECSKLTQPGANKTSYKALKNIADAERTPVWDVRSLRPDKTEDKLVEELATYFANISQPFPPLNTERIPTYDKPIRTLKVEQIAERLRQMNKPKSAVSIDPLPRFVVWHAEIYAEVLTPVKNSVKMGVKWPPLWAREEVSIIPKSAAPTTFEECRNVSCTSIFSKLTESFMLDELIEEVKPEASQFGGIRGSSTVYLLAELITESMDSLDDNRMASTLISVDLSKAFNRMNHDFCLEQLSKFGASTQTIRMVSNFLCERSMCVKLPGGHFSSSRKTPGEAPQGTKSGNLLFCVAARGLKDGPEGTLDRDTPEGILYELGETDKDPDGSQPSSPLGGTREDRRMKRGTFVLDSASEDEKMPVTALEEYHTPPPRWADRPLHGVEFIDDITGHIRCDISLAFSKISTKKETRTIWAKKAEAFFENVKMNCQARGMVVNNMKTQLLCISTAINYDLRSFIGLQDGPRFSSDQLKVVGFTFGRRPGASEHIANLRKSYGARAWTIRHLKRAGIEEETLVKIYCELVRQIFEYASPAFHTILTDQQSEVLERMQRPSLKTIFGMNTNYEDCLTRAGIETLKVRRQDHFKKFTEKAYASEK